MTTRARRPDLVSLQHMLLRLAESVDRALVSAQHLLRTHDLAEAARMLGDNLTVDRLRAELEAEAHRLLIQPPTVVGEELRTVTAALVLAGELQRIGEYVRGIVAVMARATEASYLSMPGELSQMAHHAREILQGAIRAVVTRDATAVGRLRASDEWVDELYQQICQGLLGTICANAEQSEWRIGLLWMAYHLERIADCGVHIAERAAFIATGSWPVSENQGSTPPCTCPLAHDQSARSS